MSNQEKLQKLAEKFERKLKLAQFDEGFPTTMGNPYETEVQKEIKDEGAFYGFPEDQEREINNIVERIVNDLNIYVSDYVIYNDKPNYFQLEILFSNFPNEHPAISYNVLNDNKLRKVIEYTINALKNNLKAYDFKIDTVPVYDFNLPKDMQQPGALITDEKSKNFKLLAKVDKNNKTKILDKYER